MLLPITLTITAGAAMVHVWHFVRCMRVRLAQHISVGDGGNELMLARMRAHTNFAENTPIFLILLGLIEFNSHATMWLWLAGITFIVARILHAFGMERPAPNVLRAAGMLSTIALILALAIYGIVLSYAAG